MSETQPALLLKTRRYFLFWISSLLSNIGTWMQQVAQPWVILSISRSSFWVGVDSFFMNAPSWVFTLWGGVIADRYDKRKIIFTCQGIQFLTVLALLSAMITGKAQIWMILTSSFLIGTTDALSMPAFQSIIPSIVTDKDLPRAIALNSTQFNLSRVLGPAIAGAAITAWGASVCYGANLISYVPFFLSLYWIYPREHHFQEVEKSEASFSQYRHLLSDKKVLLPLLIIFSSSLFCSPLVAFSAVLIEQIYHGSAIDLGRTMAAFGIGGILGALGSSVIRNQFLLSQKLASAVAGIFGFTLVLASNMKSIGGLHLVLILSGATMALTGTIVNSILQKDSKNNFRGRTVSLFQLVLHGGMALGGLLLGITSTSFGIDKALMVNGILAIAIQTAIYFVSR